MAKKTEFSLDDLYNVQCTLELPDGQTVYIRILTDVEVQIREEASLKAAAERERELSSADSEAYKAMVQPLDTASLEFCRSVVVAMEEIRLRAQIADELPFSFVPYPDGATDEEKMAALAKQDEHEARVMARRAALLEQRLEKYKSELDDKSEEEIRAMAKRAVVQADLLNRRYSEFMDQTVHMAARRGSPDGPAMWPIDVVRKHGRRGGLSEAVYRSVVEIYGRLDQADPWELQKKL